MSGSDTGVGLWGTHARVRAEHTAGVRYYLTIATLNTQFIRLNYKKAGVKTGSNNINTQL